MKIKAKINECDLIKGFCTAQKIIKKMKRQPTDKMFVNDATGKGLISKFYKQLMQLNKNK